MGNCTNTKNSSTSSSGNKRTEKQIRAIQIVRDEIERLKEQELFNSALMKMAKLVTLLKQNRQESTYYSEVMEIYIEMGRINQDIVSNHQNAYSCFQNAIDMSVYVYGYNNDIANKVISPFLQISRAAIEEANGPLKQIPQLPSPSTLTSAAQGRKYIKRSSTHATTRVSAIPPSLNIILEESSEHEEEGVKNWDEKHIINQIFNKNDKSHDKNTTEMLTSA